MQCSVIDLFVVKDILIMLLRATGSTRGCLRYLYYIVLHCNVVYYTVLHCTALYCRVLYCTAVTLSVHCCWLYCPSVLQLLLRYCCEQYYIVGYHIILYKNCKLKK